MTDSELRALALAATPGPWTIERGAGHAATRIVGSESVHTNGRQRNSLGISSASYSDTVCELRSDIDLPAPAATAGLIAACDPQTILSLLDRLQAAERIPREPTPEMIDAMCSVFLARNDDRFAIFAADVVAVWRAGYDAAQGAQDTPGDA